MKRLMVQELLGRFRSQEVEVDDGRSELLHLKRKIGPVLCDTLFQELRGPDHNDRRLASLCLQLMADQEVEDRAMALLHQRSAPAHSKVHALDILVARGYDHDDLLLGLSEDQRTAVFQAVVETYCELMEDPDSLARLLDIFMEFPREEQEHRLEVLGRTSDPRVVDFLWLVVELGDGSVERHARAALDQLAADGVPVGEGPVESPLSLLERQVGRIDDPSELLYWGLQSSRAGEVVLAEACFKRLLADGTSATAFLHLATIYASRGQGDLLERTVRKMESQLGAGHFQVQKAQDLLTIMATDQEDLLPLDPVESAIESVLGALLPVTPHQYHLAMLIWNQFLRFTPNPIRSLHEPLTWAAAVIFVMRRFTGTQLTMKVLRARVEVLGPMVESTAYARARRISGVLDLELDEGVLWLEDDLRVRLLGPEAEPDEPGFPDWDWMRPQEFFDLWGHQLMVAVYEVTEDVEELLQQRAELAPVNGGAEAGYSSYDWTAVPSAGPYRLGPLVRARVVLDTALSYLVVAALSYQDLSAAQELLETVAGDYLTLRRVNARPLHEIAPERMREVALGHASGFELEMCLDLLDLADPQ